MLTDHFWIGNHIGYLVPDEAIGNRDVNSANGAVIFDRVCFVTACAAIVLLTGRAITITVRAAGAFYQTSE